MLRDLKKAQILILALLALKMKNALTLKKEVRNEKKLKQVNKWTDLPFIDDTVVFEVHWVTPGPIPTEHPYGNQDILYLKHKYEHDYMNTTKI